MITETNIFYCSEINSTNSALKTYLDLRKPLEDAVFLTNFQTQGKGQGQNKWESEKGLNLTCSLLKTSIALEASKIFLLNKLVAISIVELLNSLKIENIKIKWPNDILVNSRKICGVLVLNTLSGNSLQNSIVGVGLNVNQKEFKNYERQATSILLETGLSLEIWFVFEQLLFILHQNFQKFAVNPSQFDRQYLENLYLINEWKKYIVKGQKIEGKIIGVNNFGQLQMKISSEDVLTLNMKEVTFL